VACRARAASHHAYAWSRSMSRRVLLSCSASGSLRLGARGFRDLTICLQYFSDGSTLHQRLLGAVCCSQFEHRGSGEALGLDILSAWFCACVRHDRPTAAKQTSYEHRLSDAQRVTVSFPVEKDFFARKQGKHGCHAQPAGHGARHGLATGHHGPRCARRRPSRPSICACHGVAWRSAAGRDERPLCSGIFRPVRTPSTRKEPRRSSRTRTAAAPRSPSSRGRARTSSRP
jgi:hypothetical protein